MPEDPISSRSEGLHFVKLVWIADVQNFLELKYLHDLVQIKVKNVFKRSAEK